MYPSTTRDPIVTGLPPGGGLSDHRRPLRGFPGVLDVVAVISNPRRYRTRYDLYRAFARHMAASGVRLTTVELAFGGRPWEVTTPDDPRHLRLRTNCEIWHKENLINLGVQVLPRDWQYMAWIDADVTFARPDWAQETLHALQHYAIVQPYSHVIDLKPDGSPADWFYGDGIKPASWGYCHVHQLPTANVDLKQSLLTGRMDVTPIGDDGYGKVDTGLYWHPGMAWAIRRDAWDALGGLIDYSILGAADYLMAAALTGHLTLADWLTPSYRQRTFQWRARAERAIRGDLGYVPGLITHAWHGPKAKRGYRDRWRIFHDHGFDPDLDLKHDWQGLWQLEVVDARQVGLRDAVRAYFAQRDEDHPGD